MSFEVSLIRPDRVSTFDIGRSNDHKAVLHLANELAFSNDNLKHPEDHLPSIESLPLHSANEFRFFPFFHIHNKNTHNDRP